MVDRFDAKDFEFCVHTYGDAKLNGIEVALTQDPYIDQAQRSLVDTVIVYRAHARDVNGDTYIVTWAVLDGAIELEDASDACDWDNPISIEPI